MPPEGPRQFRQYFSRVNAQYPGQHWENGVMMSDWWLRLEAAESVTQAEIDSFIQRLQAEPDPGSGWLDLYHQFKHWANQRGFKA